MQCKPAPRLSKLSLIWDLIDGQISVTADDSLRIGHNLTSVQYPAAAGGGSLATAMGTRAIHCLHYIWQDHDTRTLENPRSIWENRPFKLMGEDACTFYGDCSEDFQSCEKIIIRLRESSTNASKLHASKHVSPNRLQSLVLEDLYYTLQDWSSDDG